MRSIICGVTIAVVITLTATLPVAADRLTSPNYQIDTSVAAPFGGLTSSPNYKLVSGGGEAANGSGASSSYKLGYGYVPQLAKSIQLTILNPSVNFGTITPGVSKTVSIGSEVVTDAPGYTVSIGASSNLASGSNIIPSITGGTIAAPASWTEGTTKGMGLTITSAPLLPSKWGSGGNYNYAAVPTATTALYSRSGYSGGVKDVINLQGRIDTSGAQAPGSYSNTITLTATTTP